MLCRPLINKPLPLTGGYSRDPNIKALKRSGFINHGSTLRFMDVTPENGASHGKQALTWHGIWTYIYIYI